jgi:hypothetical protein
MFEWIAKLFGWGKSVVDLGQLRTKQLEAALEATTKNVSSQAALNQTEQKLRAAEHERAVQDLVERLLSKHDEVVASQQVVAELVKVLRVGLADALKADSDADQRAMAALSQAQAGLNFLLGPHFDSEACRGKWFRGGQPADGNEQFAFAIFELWGLTFRLAQRQRSNSRFPLAFLEATSQMPEAPMVDRAKAAFEIMSREQPLPPVPPGVSGGLGPLTGTQK